MKTALITLFFILNISVFDGGEIKKISDLKPDKIYVDKFGNIYLVKKENFIKLNAEGKPEYELGNIFGEKISYADITNPLKILLCYEESGRIIFSDNKLSTTGDEIKIENLGIYDEFLVSVSETGNINIFENTENILRVFNSEFKEIYEKNLFGINGFQDFMTSYGNLIFIKNTEGTVNIFDNFGNFIFAVPHKIKYKFQADDEIISYFDKEKNTYFFYYFRKNKTFSVDLPENLEIKDVFYKNPFLYLACSSGIYVQKINEKTDKQ